MALLTEAFDDELVQLGMLWVAKEAIRKSLERTRPAGFLSMRLNEVRQSEGYWLLDFHLEDAHHGEALFTTVVHVDGHYCLGVCTIPGVQGDA